MGIFKKKQPADAVDVVLLRNEVIELKERLAAAEQAKASLDDRLSSLAATTMVLSSATKNDTAELVDQIEQLQSRLATTTAVGAKVDELHQRVIDVEHRGQGTSDPQIAERVASLSRRLDEVAELAAAPVAPDAQLAARLDELTGAAAVVSEMDQRVAELDARLAEQAAVAAEVASLRDRLDGVAAAAAFATTAAQSDTVSALEQRIGDLDARLANQAPLGDELAVMRQRLDDVQATASTAVTAAKAATAAVEAGDAALGAAELDERLSTVTGQVDGRLMALTGEVEERIAAVSARLAAAEADARAAREHAASLEAQIDQAVAAADERFAAQVGPRIDQLGSRLDGRIDEQVGSLHERLAAAEHDARQAREQSGDLDSMRGQLAEQALWAARMGSIDDRLGEVQHRLDEVAARTTDPADIDDLRRRLDEVAGSIPVVPDTTETDRRVGELAERVALTAEEARIARDSAAALHERLDTDTTASATADALAEMRAAMSARLDQVDARLAAADDDAARLRADATALQQRLDEVAASIPGDDRVEGLVAAAHASLGGQVAELWERVVATEEQAGHARTQAAHLEQQLAAAGGRLDQLSSLESRVDELGLRGVDVESLQRRLDDIAATVPDTTGLQAELAEFSIRVANSEIDAQTARERAAALDDQLESVSTQLANQLAELGREIDALATRDAAPSHEIDDATIQSLRSGQVRLATEQARYEISFREDLAVLAEQVRQLRGRS